MIPERDDGRPVALAVPFRCPTCDGDALDVEVRDLVAVIAELAGAVSAEFTPAAAPGVWATPASDVAPGESGGAATGARVVTMPVVGEDGATIGGVVLREPGTMLHDGATMGLLLDALGRLVASRGRISGGTEPTWFVVASPTGVLRAVSPHVADLLGRGDESPKGMNVFEVIHPGDHEPALESLAQTAKFPGEKFPVDWRFLHVDGSSAVLEVTSLVRDLDGGDDLVFEVRETEARDVQDALISDQARLLAMIGRGAPLEDVLGETARFVVKTIPYDCALLLVDDDHDALSPIGWTNVDAPLLDAMRGAPIAGASITPGLVAARRHSDRCPDVAADPAWRARIDPACLGAVRATSCWSVPVIAGDGTESLGVLALTARFDRAPQPHEARIVDLACGIAGVAIERHRAEELLLHRSLHDPLTGLPNRTLFLDRLTHAVADTRPPYHHTAVMLIDLDRFKVINDALGHEAGDEVLVEIANRLRSIVRPTTTIARFGGDEFTVLCERLNGPRDALLIAERLLDIVAEPVPLGSGTVSMSMSIGMTVVLGPVPEPSAMLRDADAAMYRAKAHGRNRVEIFDDGMRQLALARLELERSMEASIDRGDFALVHQPEFDLAAGTLVGAETLLRWRHPTRGSVPPTEFIPIAEETGAILSLGEWVLRRTCEGQGASRRHAPGAQPFTSWVNVSVVQLLQPDFARRVAAILDDTDADPGRIGLEITESALMTDGGRALSTLTALRDLGLRLAIDDFGTGYSSLSYLRRLPVDVLKIDRSFVQPLGAEPHATSIVGGIIQLAHAVGCTVVAEGIETSNQLHILQTLGCDIGQGYLLGRPQPTDQPLPHRVDLPRLHAPDGAVGRI